MADENKINAAETALGSTNLQELIKRNKKMKKYFIAKFDGNSEKRYTVTQISLEYTIQI